MKTIITVLITLYFVINIKLAYDYYERWKYNFYDDTKKTAILKVILFILFSVIVYILNEIYLIFKEISSFFQFKFLYLYYFTNKFKNMDKNKLDKINNWAKHFNPEYLRGKIIHKTIKMINKLNGYDNKSNN